MARVSGWRRCDTCRKVLAADAFDGAAATCSACVAGPAPRKRAAPAVTVRKAATTRPAAPEEPQAPRLGSVGSGDLEVRERRALRAAAQALQELHPEEFAVLLRNARAAEGLRPLSGPPGEES